LKISKKKISFITFNYDRSLEFFLMTSLKNRFKKSQNEVAEKLKKIPIVHLYGKLGPLPWEVITDNDYYRNYEPLVLPHHLRKSSKSLKIIYDKLELDNPEFKQAKILLGAARKIYFLGFGYHKDNLDRLKIKSITTIPASNSLTTSINTSSNKVVEGTSFKLPMDLKESIPKNYKIKFPNSDWDISDFIEQRIRLE
jgi:SIR2-like domain